MSASATVASATVASATDAPHPLLAAFGLTDSVLAKTLYSTGSVITGGAALYWHLIQQDPSVSVPADLDLDIWMLNCSSADYRHSRLAFDHFELVLGVAGYVRQTPEKRAAELIERYRSKNIRPGHDYNFSPSDGIITRIQNFIHPGLGRKIRIIAVQVPSYAEVTKTFDLDICKMVVTSCHFENTDCDAGTFVSGYCLGSSPKHKSSADLNKLLTQRVMTPSYLPGSDLDNCLARVEKYYARGWAFEGVAPACDHCGRCGGETVRLSLEKAKELVRNLVSAANSSTAGTTGGGSAKKV